MYRWTSRLPLSLLVLLSIGGATRADVISQVAPWTYVWSAPTFVAATNDSTGGINMNLSQPGPTNLSGSSDINAVILSTALAGHQYTFVDAPYTLTLTLTDGNSGATKQLTFQGEFGPDGAAQQSTLSTTNVQITNKFLNPTETVQLGTNDYTVSLNSFVPPGLPGNNSNGSIGADVTIAPASGGGGGSGTVGVQDVPEPSTLLLTGLAVPAGLAWWRTRGLRRREVTND
jgi:hypothetical protein